MSCHFNHLLIIIIEICQDHCSKCNVNIVTIEPPLIVQHLSNGFSIPPKSISFKFGWMNCNPFNATLVCGTQGHSLGIELHFLHCFRVTLLCLCSKFSMPRNGRVILDEALLNFSVATTLWLPYIH
jgi:hypothetical protein